MGGMFTAGQGGMGANGSGHDLISSCSSMSYSDYEDDEFNQSNEASVGGVALPSSLAGAQCMSSVGKRGGELAFGLPKAPFAMQGSNHLRLLLAERGHLAWIKYSKEKESGKEIPEKGEEHKDENKVEIGALHTSPVYAPGEDIEMKE